MQRPTTHIYTTTSMLNNAHDGSSGFPTSGKPAIWQSEWMDELWQQLTDGTYNGIGNVVVVGDLENAEKQLQIKQN